MILKRISSNHWMMIFCITLACYLAALAIASSEFQRLIASISFCFVISFTLYNLLTRNDRVHLPVLIQVMPKTKVGNLCMFIISCLALLVNKIMAVSQNEFLSSLLLWSNLLIFFLLFQSMRRILLILAREESVDVDGEYDRLGLRSRKDL